MFTTIKVTDGFAAELPALKDREIKFEPGLNVLFGKNGSGKSVLLSLLGSYAGIADDSYGWSGAIESTRDGTTNLAAARRNHSIGHCGVECAWDGAPVHKPRLERAQMSHFDFDTEGGMSAQLGEMMGKYSSGITTFARLAKALDSLEKAPKTSDAYLWVGSKRQPVDEKNKWAKEQWDAWFASFPTPHGTRLTLLLDEPDRALSFDMQHRVWTALPRLAKKFDCQIIVASHSPFSVIAKDTHRIEMDPGYLTEAYQSLKVLGKELLEPASAPTAEHFGAWLASPYAARLANGA